MYNSYFGFRETPFSVTPDPRFFYTNPVYREAFAALLYGIKAKKGFIVITGEVGTGKTTLLRKLMRSLEATTHSVFIFNTQLNFPELLQLILHDLSLNNTGKNMSTMIQVLNEYLIQQLKKGHIVSLLIDEAQGLSDEALEGLRLLSNLETDREKLLQMVLIGQPELDAKLNRSFLRQLKQRVAIRCQLDPLIQGEVGDYIRHRLQVAGYEGREIFSKRAIESIWSYSRGIPRPINIICDNALLSAYAASQKKISAAMIREVARDFRLELEPQSANVEAPEKLRVQLPKADVANPNVITSRDEAFRVLKAKDSDEPEVQFPKVETTTPKLPSTDEAARSFTDEALQVLEDLGSRRLTRYAVGTLLVLLFLGSVTSVALQNRGRVESLGLQAESVLNLAGKRLEILKDDLGELLVYLTTTEDEPEEAQLILASEPLDKLSQNASDGKALSPPGEVDALSKETELTPPAEIRETTAPETRLSSVTPSSSLSSRARKLPIVVKHSSIHKIAAEFYGTNSALLAIDLIKEFNPQIKNLNRVSAGEGIRLPPLTRETLLRKQTDSSYRLIIASFSTLAGALEFNQAIRHTGYRVVITPQRISDNLLLHRVEIAGLKNLKAVDQAWDTAVVNHWFPFLDSQSAQ